MGLIDRVSKTFQDTTDKINTTVQGTADKISATVQGTADGLSDQVQAAAAHIAGTPPAPAAAPASAAASAAAKGTKTNLQRARDILKAPMPKFDFQSMRTLHQHPTVEAAKKAVTDAKEIANQNIEQGKNRLANIAVSHSISSMEQEQLRQATADKAERLEGEKAKQARREANKHMLRAKAHVVAKHIARTALLGFAGKDDADALENQAFDEQLKRKMEEQRREMNAGKRKHKRKTMKRKSNKRKHKKRHATKKRKHKKRHQTKKRKLKKKAHKKKAHKKKHRRTRKQRGGACGCGLTN